MLFQRRPMRENRMSNNGGIQTDILAAANLILAAELRKKNKNKNIPHPKMHVIQYSGTENFTFTHCIYLFPKSMPHLCMNFSWTYPKLYKQEIEEGSMFSIMFTQVSSLCDNGKICIVVKDVVPSLRAIQMWTLFRTDFQFKGRIPVSSASLLWYTSKLILFQSQK